MNREQRRKLKLTKEQADFVDRIRSGDPIPPESKVKLNYNQIVSRNDYKKLKQSYKDFVENNKETIFTTNNSEDISKTAKLVSLKEDEADPKWLFWVGDLMLVD